MATKIKTIAPIITQLKRTDVRTFDGLNNLNKRFSKAIGTAITSLTENFSAKITETFFLGYYIDGGYVGVLGNELLFKSPVDNYQYKQSQVKYIWSMFSTRTANVLNPDGTTYHDGQLNNPDMANLNSGAGNLYWFKMWVDQNDGSVNTNVSYFDGAEHQTNDGILAISVICQRSLP